MLFKLSFRNITRSVKDYAIYFFTLVLGVTLFYVFNSVGSQAAVLELNNAKKLIVELLSKILSGMSILVVAILGALIIYASRFLIKRRNKEFAIYLTLGMSKRKISRLLFFETLMIGIISLAVGLLVGIGASQLISILIGRLFEADMSKFQFVFSEKAFFDTILYFGLIYLVVIVFNTIIVGRLKIIDLLHGSKKSEKAFLKNPLLRAIVFVLSSFGLSYAYWWVTNDKVSMMDRINNLLWPVAIGVITTFLLFWSFSGLIMEILTRSKRFYYRGLNSFIFRQVSSKINTAVVSMSLISLLLFLTISILSLCFSINESMKKELAYNTPVDAFIELTDYNAVFGPNGPGYGPSVDSSDQDWNSQVKESQKYMQKSIYQRLTEKDEEIAKSIKEHLEINVYADHTLTFKQALQAEYLTGLVGEFMSKTAVPILRVSDYNKIAKLYHREEISLADNQYQILADYKPMSDSIDKSLASGFQINYRGQTLSPVAKKHLEGFVTSSGMKSNTGILIVPDKIASGQTIGSRVLLVNYNTSADHTAQQIDNDIRRVYDLGNLSIEVHTTDEALQKTKEKSKAEEQRPSGVSFSYMTKILIYTSSIGLQAIATFVGFYLGIIFLISSAAILALKQLSESSDNIEKYAALRRLGASNKMLNRALFIQIAIFFVFPLLVGILHSVFGIKFASSIIEVFGSGGLLASIPITASMLILIYGGYFLLTYLSSKRIISEKQLRRD
ncbi:ABC transporter permease [TM7 phylum sp. oral taxon 351]|nr:ABC transporter permease [TM7 phylum sp. oral taxon 351]